MTDATDHPAHPGDELAIDRRWSATVNDLAVRTGTTGRTWSGLAR